MQKQTLVGMSDSRTKHGRWRGQWGNDTVDSANISVVTVEFCLHSISDVDGVGRSSRCSYTGYDIGNSDKFTSFLLLHLLP